MRTGDEADAYFDRLLTANSLDEMELRARLADVVPHFNNKWLVMHETECRLSEMATLEADLIARIKKNGLTIGRRIKFSQAV